jgi:hypothetical protein
VARKKIFAARKQCEECLEKADVPDLVCDPQRNPCGPQMGAKLHCFVLLNVKDFVSEFIWLDSSYICMKTQK